MKPESIIRRTPRLTPRATVTLIWMPRAWSVGWTTFVAGHRTMGGALTALGERLATYSRWDRGEGGAADRKRRRRRAGERTRQGSER